MRLIRRKRRRTGSNVPKTSGCINADCNGLILSQASSPGGMTSGVLKHNNSRLCSGA